MKYKSLKHWKGSPNGLVVTAYEKGVEYDHADLGDDLAEVALNEGWIEQVDGVRKPAEPPKAEPKRQLVEVTLEMIKDGMTVKQMQKMLKDNGIVTRAKKEDPLAKLILKHKLFSGE